MGTTFCLLWILSPDLPIDNVYGIHRKVNALHRERDTSYVIVAPNAGMSGPLTLTRDNPAVFSPDVEARIRAEFEGLVAGDAIVIDTTTNSRS